MWLAGPGQPLGLTGGLTDVAQIELFLKAIFKTRRQGRFDEAFTKSPQERTTRESRQALKRESGLGLGSDRRGR